MAAALLAATRSPLPLAFWRRRPLLAAPPPEGSSLSLTPVARAPAPARGGGDATEEPGQAPGDWAGRLALGALLGSAALLGCRGGRGLHQGVRVRAAGGGVSAKPRLARRRRRVHNCHIAGARAARSNPGRVLDAPSPRPADRPGSFDVRNSQRSAWATRIMDLLFERARGKASPVKEFQWLGLMLFVAVLFPWTSAIIASVLDMPFLSGLSINFVGVVLAGLVVNLLMNFGLKYVIGTGALLFIVSTVIWGALEGLKKSSNTK
ncbi:hypothetical protein VPH35_093264 [Triticum aestivum]